MHNLRASPRHDNAKLRCTQLHLRRAVALATRGEALTPLPVVIPSNVAQLLLKLKH
jgi:hypothetical protein